MPTAILRACFLLCDFVKKLKAYRVNNHPHTARTCKRCGVAPSALKDMQKRFATLTPVISNWFLVKIRYKSLHARCRVRVCFRDAGIPNIFLSSLRFSHKFPLHIQQQNDQGDESLDSILKARNRSAVFLSS